ncbi:uncharacterized protein LOC124235155 [Equus quagga]|uniref:uncharacterized protein LOC124235155 n=1 Tax=Equus quagga TaxID=89248 RepID=UPI001EE27831|nr:uncharacterized protein LOC124235155 [Equus quagga]
MQTRPAPPGSQAAGPQGRAEGGRAARLLPPPHQSQRRPRPPWGPRVSATPAGVRWRRRRRERRPQGRALGGLVPLSVAGVARGRLRARPVGAGADRPLGRRGAESLSLASWRALHLENIAEHTSNQGLASRSYNNPSKLKSKNRQRRWEHLDEGEIPAVLWQVLFDLGPGADPEVRPVSGERVPGRRAQDIILLHHHGSSRRLEGGGGVLKTSWGIRVLQRLWCRETQTTLGFGPSGCNPKGISLSPWLEAKQHFWDCLHNS